MIVCLNDIKVRFEILLDTDSVYSRSRLLDSPRCDFFSENGPWKFCDQYRLLERQYRSAKSLGTFLSMFHYSRITSFLINSTYSFNDLRPKRAQIRDFIPLTLVLTLITKMIIKLIIQWWLQIRELQIREFSLIWPKITKMANKGILNIALFDIKIIGIRLDFVFISTSLEF